jgi:nitrate reductase NapE
MGLRSRDNGPAAAGSAIASNDAHARRRELFAFLVLAVVIWPILAVGIVGGYGFIVWMSQLILGPPGPPRM